MPLAKKIGNQLNLSNLIPAKLTLIDLLIYLLSLIISYYKYIKQKFKIKETMSKKVINDDCREDDKFFAAPQFDEEN